MLFIEQAGSSAPVPRGRQTCFPDSQVDQGVKDEPYKGPSLDRVGVRLEWQESARESERSGEESDGREEGKDGGRVQQFGRRLVVDGGHLGFRVSAAPLKAFRV